MNGMIVSDTNAAGSFSNIIEMTNLGDDDSATKDQGSSALGRFNGTGRLDYMLEDTSFAYSYLGSLNAHVNYFDDGNVIDFIMQKL